MAEVDWKEKEDEIRLAIIRILTAKKYSFKLSDRAIYSDNDTFEIIELIEQEELIPVGYCLDIIDIDSDSYVFTIIQLSNQEEVSNLFGQLK